MLLLSVTVNLGLLVYFKYSNFFVENINAVLSSVGVGEIPWVKLVLPIGISFYTFETLTYVVDVYRRVHKPLKNFWDYQLYIILFPKLIAGPIIRYHEISDQITNRDKYDTIDDKLLGFYRFIIGLAKKVLLANVMGQYVADIDYFKAEQLSSGLAWAGALAYTLQIYFDFSGYSDMAIGIGRMLGFKFPENFNNPYTSSSITEFWRRWHITLGSWMRNYLYIPLGGNKVSAGRMYFNLWLVFLASGLWHGASWSFIVWGAYHGTFLVIERLFLGKWLEKLPGVVSNLYCFFIVLIGWVFFRIETLSEAMTYLHRMFVWNAGVKDFYASRETIFIGVLCIFFAVIIRYNKVMRSVGHSIYDSATLSFRKHLAWTSIGVVLFVLSIASIAGSSFNPFIYFRF